MPSSGTQLPEISFRGPGGWPFLENLMGSLPLPLMSLLIPALFPVVRKLRARRRACCQLVLVQPPAAKGPDARRALPPRWELSLPLCSPGVNSILCPGRLPLPQPGCPPPSLSRHSQLGRLVVEQRGAGGAELVGTSSASRALSLFPSVPGGLALFREPSAARAASDRHR